MAFAPAPKPASLLGYHRLLSPTAGVRVSALCLGGANFGLAWKDLMGECTKANAFAIMDCFYQRGGNFIDTANNYQDGQSEAWIGEWIAARGIRDEIVLATKYTNGSTKEVGIRSNFQGNHSKSLKLSVERSLSRLRTSYIDLLWVHWWDYTTSIPEVMNSLHHLVARGQVLYLGISDSPAWLVVKCNEYARHHGLTQFCVYQGHWNAAVRDFERDIIPMCEAEGMGLCPWGTLGSGMFKTPEQFNAADRDGRKTGPQDAAHARVARTLAELADRKGTLPTSIALAYVLHKTPYVFPIIGGRTTKHLVSNIEALGIELADEEVEAIEGTAPFDHGFPNNFIFGFGGSRVHAGITAEDIALLRVATSLETVPKPRAIEPRHFQKKFEK